MKKRWLSALLAVALLITSVPAALAAKKVEEGAEENNIYKDIGKIETEEQVAKYGYGSASISLAEGAGPDGSNCLKVQVTNEWGGVRLPWPGVIGETYDISFDVRTDATPHTLQPIMYYTGLKWKYMNPPGQFSSDWTRYTITFDNDGIDDQGSKGGGAGEIDIRYGTGRELVTYYIDNVSVVPHGKVEGADYSSLLLEDTKKSDEEDTTSTVEKVTFADVENHWAKETVNTLATYGYIAGMGGNTYSPDTNVTRAQFVELMMNSYQLMEQKDYKASYADVKGDEWFASSLSAATTLGFLDPAMTFNNRFLPDQAITREEAASIAARVAAYNKMEKKGASSVFKDEGSISAWAKQPVKDAAEYGLIKGYETGAYQPKANITRAEAATILRRIVEAKRLFGVYVDGDNGSDTNEGTAEAPFKSLEAARDKVRLFNGTMSNDIYVYIRGRVYMEKTFKLGVEDSGQNGHRIIYTSWGDEKPVLSMGKQFTGFTLHDAEKNIYKIPVGKIESRQAYFNNVRGIRARTVDAFTNAKQNREEEFMVYTSEDTELLTLAYPDEVEAIWFANWRQYRGVIDEVIDLGDGTVETRFAKAGTKATKKSLDSYNDLRNYPTYFENAYEFLDQPSEWYLDTHARYLYYIPREGEDMSSMVLTLPQGENILAVNSTSYEKPVQNLTFDNLEFADTGWMYPTEYGGLFLSQNMHVSNDDPNADGFAPHAVWFNNCYYIDFINNNVTRCGANGLLTSEAIQYCNVIGNEFFDISGTAMNLGNPVAQTYSHGGFGGDDLKIPVSEKQYNQYNNVLSNFFYAYAIEYEPGTAFGCAFPRHSNVSYNYFGTAPYSQIHAGWCWDEANSTGTATYNFEISHNYFAEANSGRCYDGANVYTLGATDYDALKTGVFNRINWNYFENSRNAYGCVYPDQGARIWDIKENVINMKDVRNWRFNFDDMSTITKDKIYWLMIWTDRHQHFNVDNNYTTTDVVRNDSHNDTVVISNTQLYPEANWPAEAQAIIDDAYIQSEYLDNFDKKEGPLSFVALEREYVVPVGSDIPLEIAIYGNYMESYNLSDFDIDYWISEPDILTVDENGVMRATGNGQGEVWVVANVNVGGYIQSKTFRVFAGEEYVYFGARPQVVNLSPGYSTQLGVGGVTKEGRVGLLDPEKCTFTVADESIVTVSKYGAVQAVGEGKTTIRVTGSGLGRTVDQEVPVVVRGAGSDEALELPYKLADASFFDPKFWTGESKVDGDSIGVTGSPTYYTQELDNELIAFDLTLNNPGGWPSLALCAPDINRTYADSDVYFIGFKKDHIEVQRFNNGSRTMIYGSNQYAPIAGPGIMNDPADPLYTYGEKMSVIVGTLKTEDGATRLILTIDGKNVLDYTDTDTALALDKGLFGVYDSGTFSFSPYTGPALGGATNN